MEKGLKTSKYEDSSYLGARLDKSGDGEDSKHESFFLSAEKANKLYAEKNEYRLTVFERVKRLFNDEQGDFITQYNFSNKKDAFTGDKIEAMSQIDEHLFCDDVFRGIHKICFGYIDSGEEASSHIMHRVLAGESVNVKLEGERMFVYDKDDAKAEALLNSFIKAESINELLQMREVLSGKVKGGDAENIVDRGKYNNEDEQGKIDSQRVN